MAFWKLLALAGFVSTAASALPTQTYSAQVISVDYQFCGWSNANPPTPLLGNTPCHLPNGYTVNTIAPYQAVLAKLRINGRIYELLLDGVPRRPCVQKTTGSTECAGGVVPPMSQMTPFFSYFQDDHWALKLLFENWALMKTIITIQVVSSTISNPSLTTVLDSSNVRVIDDGAGNRLPVKCGYDGTTVTYDTPRCKNDYP